MTAPQNMAVNAAWGNALEDALRDWLFTQGIRMEKASSVDQSQGVDWWTADGLGIDLKSDKEAHRYGNAFCEVWTNDQKCAGWVYKPGSKWVLYYIPQTGFARLAVLANVRYWIEHWKREGRPFKIVPKLGTFGPMNAGGFCVPFKEFDKCTIRTYQLPTAKQLGVHVPGL